jgi:hypothetical protein
MGDMADISLDEWDAFDDPAWNEPRPSRLSPAEESWLCKLKARFRAEKLARETISPMQKTKPPYILAWLNRGCMVCGRPMRGKTVYAHARCAVANNMDFAKWAHQCDAAVALLTATNPPTRKR